MSLTEIKTAIEALSERERCELMAWLHPWPDDEWDRQMAEDAKAGKFDRILAEADEEKRRGELRPFP